MKRFCLVLILALTSLFLAASASAGVTTEKVQQSFTMFNPCTNEVMAVDLTRHYMSWRHGDRTHVSDASAVGLTTGTEYVVVHRVEETNQQGFFEVIRFISLGSETNMTLTDDLGDAEDPVITCS